MHASIHVIVGKSLMEAAAHLSLAGLPGSATARMGGGVGCPLAEVPLLPLSLLMAACSVKGGGDGRGHAPREGWRLPFG